MSGFLRKLGLAAPAGPALNAGRRNAVTAAAAVQTGRLVAAGLAAGDGTGVVANQWHGVLAAAVAQAGDGVRNYDLADASIVQATAGITALLAAQVAYTAKRAQAQGLLAALAPRADPALPAQTASVATIDGAATTNNTYAAQDAALDPVIAWATARAATWALVDAHVARLPVLTAAMATAVAAPGNGVAGHSLAPAWAALTPARAALPAVATPDNAADLAGLYDAALAAAQRMNADLARNANAHATYDARHANLRPRVNTVVDVATTIQRNGGQGSERLQSALEVFADYMTRAEAFAGRGDWLQAAPALGPVAERIDEAETEVLAAEPLVRRAAQVGGMDAAALDAIDNDILLGAFDEAGLNAPAAGPFTSAALRTQLGTRLARAMKVPADFAAATRDTAAATVTEVMADPGITAGLNAMGAAAEAAEAAHDRAHPALAEARERVEKSKSQRETLTDAAAERIPALKRALTDLAAAEARLPDAELAGRPAQREVKQLIATARTQVNALRDQAAAGNPDLAAAIRATKDANRALTATKAAHPFGGDMVTLGLAIATAGSIAARYCAKLGVPAVEVGSNVNGDPDILGGYMRATGDIVLNAAAASTMNPKVMFDIIMHETTHYYQHTLAQQFAAGAIAADNPNFEAARVFAANFGYYTTSDGSLAQQADYEHQPVEAQAWDVGVSTGRQALNLKKAARDGSAATPALR
jgi:hypothetical protein